MGFIKIEVEIVGVLKSKKVLALFDSGATFNYIKEELTDGENVVEDIGFPVYEGDHNVILADNSVIKGIQIRFSTIIIKKRKQDYPIFVLVDKLTEDVIIGVELMQRMGIVLDPHCEKIVFRRQKK
jgi:predicted aspartyl protease